ncbi:O-linked N-acetylglucosamine transferase family protein [Pseudothauera lacus]|uniref:protein O-GlcNAc transferase n=1 Tax=Pseudothauera lacus TaxID=2136175 RepID=A0A2T4IHV6_9RHOO|nr:tetratricopeptide repeat protein [Pseudothauera lacus]PTD97355.1 hypothetical protein C8261_04950 [Pseudothauera lacus]
MTTARRDEGQLVQAFKEAVAHHQAGRLDEAAQAYQSLLVEWPANPGVSYNFGLLLFGKGDVDAGLSLLKAACEAAPDGQPYWLVYIDALLHVGRSSLAESVLAHARKRGFAEEVLAPRVRQLERMRDEVGRTPAESEVQRLTQLYNQNRHQEFEAHARHLLQHFPSFAVAWKALGVALLVGDRAEEAIPVLQRCIELLPDDAEAHNNLGSMLHKVRRHREAEDCFRRALRLQPGFAAAQRNLAIVLRDLGRYVEAETQLRELIKRQPEDPLLHSNLGLVFVKQERMPEAEVCYRKALALRPDFAECMAQLASVHQEMGRLGEAEAGYQRALELAPRLPGAHEGLGRLALLDGRPGEAATFYERAMVLAPESLDVHSSLLYTLNYAAIRNEARMVESARAFGRKLAARHRGPYKEWAVNPQAQRLRIGFVSGDLRKHPVGYFLEGILPVLDRERFELVAYPTSRDSDVLTEQLKASFAAWHPLYGLDDEQAAARIHADGVHVLIDLSGHTAHHRLGVFSRKPAPVQLTWPGYFATTGLEEIDWFLADPVTAPAEDEGYFTERVWRLPDTRLCFTPPVDAPPVAPLPLLVNGYPTYGCFQNLNKLTDDVLQLWSRVLSTIPQARLRVQSHQLRNEGAMERLRKRLVAAGIATERVDLHPPSGRQSYLRAHAEVDAILDTFPYTGGTTTCEALWMGVPTLTLQGGTLIGRQGASILEAAGLPDWVAQSEEDYVAKAATLIADSEVLSRLRGSLREQLLRTALFDTPRFARNLEQALMEMWEAAGEIALCSSPLAMECVADQHAHAETDMPSEAEIAEMVALFRDERHEPLVDFARLLTERFPAYGIGWKVLGVACKTLQRHDEALAAMLRAVELLPEDVESVSNLGLVYFELERYEEAVVCHRQALEIDPADVDAVVNLAAALFRLDRLDEAIAALQDALALHPQHFDLHLRLAEALWKQKKLAEAQVHFERAAELGLNNVEAHYRLGNLLYERRRHEEAEKALRYALSLDPAHQRAKGVLGLVLLACNRHIEAEQLYREAISEQPEMAEHYCNLGTAVQGQGRLHEGLDCIRRALELRPEWVEINSNLLFSMNYAAEDDPQRLLEEALAYGERVAHQAGHPFSDWDLDDRPRRLRVGFVSGDLCAHPVGYFLEGILPVLDRERLELIAYPTVDRSDVFTEQLKSSFEAWRPLWALSDDAAAERIRKDGVHLLIDLSGHTAYNRLGVFARKPSPVQVSWPGYFATTGVAQIDWFIADRVTVPESHQCYFSERIWYLPDTRLCFTPPLNAPSVSPLPALTEGVITFGCFQNLSKVNDEVLRVWARVMEALPGSRLRLQTRHFNDPEGRQQMRQRLAACGIDPERAALHPGTSRKDYLAAHAEVDMILDTFPYTGGTTTCEALWMGVPTLTLCGDTLIARQGASMMAAAGLHDWVVEDVDTYVVRALALARDVNGLAALRANMRQRLVRTALFDTPKFARQLEDALWNMWAEYARSRNYQEMSA